MNFASPCSCAPLSAEVLNLACAHHAKTIEDLQQQLMDAHLNSQVESALEQEFHTPRASGGYGSFVTSPREGSQSLSVDNASESLRGASQPGSWNTSRHASLTFEQEQNMECATPSSSSGVGVEAYGAHVAAVHDSDASSDLSTLQHLQNLQHLHGGLPQGDEGDGDGRRNGGRMHVSYLSLVQEAANAKEEEAGRGQAQAQVGRSAGVEYQGDGRASRVMAAVNPPPPLQAHSGHGNGHNVGGVHNGEETSEGGAGRRRTEHMVDAVGMDDHGQRNSWGLGENLILRTCTLRCMSYMCCYASCFHG
jgi:hypothetical protein